MMIAAFFVGPQELIRLLELAHDVPQQFQVNLRACAGHHAAVGLQGEGTALPVDDDAAGAIGHSSGGAEAAIIGIRVGK